MDDQNWLEKLGILQKLNDIQLVQERQNAKIDEVLRMAGDHHKTLYGHDGDPGLDKSVDRLNEKEKIRAVWYGATVVIFLERAWSWLSHTHP